MVAGLRPLEIRSPLSMDFAQNSHQRRVLAMTLRSDRGVRRNHNGDSGAPNHSVDFDTYDNSRPDLLRRGTIRISRACA